MSEFMSIKLNSKKADSEYRGISVIFHILLQNFYLPTAVSAHSAEDEKDFNLSFLDGFVPERNMLNF